MNWDAIGAVAELLGSVAVLATLIYLSVQVKNAKKEFQATIRQNHATANLDMTMETIRSPALLAAQVRAVEELGDVRPGIIAFQEKANLSLDEAIVLNNYFSARWRQVGDAVLGELDHLPEATQNTFARATARLFGTGAGKVFLDATRETIPADDPTLTYVTRVTSHPESGGK